MLSSSSTSNRKSSSPRRRKFCVRCTSPWRTSKSMPKIEGRSKIPSSSSTSSFSWLSSENSMPAKACASMRLSVKPSSKRASLPRPNAYAYSSMEKRRADSPRTAPSTSSPPRWSSLGKSTSSIRGYQCHPPGARDHHARFRASLGPSSFRHLGGPSVHRERTRLSGEYP